MNIDPAASGAGAPRGWTRIASHPATALVVLALGILLSAVAAYRAAAQVQSDLRRDFDNTVAETRSSIEFRIRAHSDLLLGLRGLFLASESVDRNEFRDYVNSLELDRYPGVAAISYAQRITAAEKPDFETAMRKDTSTNAGGYPDFSIRPAGIRPEYMVMKYIEPEAQNKSALGLDLGGDPVRLAALERLRDSGGITATGSIALALDPNMPRGFAMRLPIYRKGMPLDTVAQRRAALAGTISAAYVLDKLMRQVLPGSFLQTVHLLIYDFGFSDGAQGQSAGPDNLLFDSRLLEAPAAQRPAEARLDAGLASVVRMEVGNRRWDLHFTARPEFASFSNRSLPWAVLLGGSVISLLLFGLIRSLASVGVRAETLAARITEDLRDSEAKLSEAQRRTQELIEALPNPIFFKDRNGRYLGVNKAWERYFGTARDAFLGKTVHDLYPGNPDVAQRLHGQDELLWKQPGTQVYETSIATPDGQRHEAIYYKATLTNTDGSVAGLIGTIIDITERKRAEQALVESETRYRSVVGAMAEGVLVRDRNADIVACNASAERILGRTLEQMAGSPYIHPDWEWLREDGTPVPRELRPANQALRTGQAQTNAVLRLRKGDGSALWLSMNAQPLFWGNDSAPAGVVTTIADITSRKNAELRHVMEHAVTRLLSEADSPERVMPDIIRIICEAFGFACGARVLLEENRRVMRRAESWSVDSAEIEQFIQTDRPPISWANMAGGLLRRAWASREVVWIRDTADERSFQRAALAASAGLRSAVAFPVLFGNEVLGVMEFFSREKRSPDEVVLRSLRAIGAQIGQFMARKQAEERFHHLAHYDELTGLPNRSMFNQRLGHALAQARRNSEPLAVLFIDLDRFKNINDTLGHQAGDRVLKEVAQRLQGSLREGDTVGRLGGDEFVVLIEDLPDPMHVSAVAQKILTAVAKPVNVGAHEYALTASIGISTYPGDSDDVPGLLKNADIAMYRAKEQGKNNYQFYSVQMNVHTVERLALESALRHALERNEFVLHYQPKIDIASGGVTGMEALVRWERPGYGLIPPMQFIPLAEETGLIVPIGEWVLRTACSRNQSWQAQGIPRLRLAVNLSARQFAQASLLQDVSQILTESGMDPALLELEITESMVTYDPEHAVKLLDSLKQMGIHISMDDFGTGYSSLSYLKRFPIDSLKIDRSFIRDIPGDADDAAIARAIIAMARSLRLNVIAEGVESEAQLNFLREHLCNEMQGYYFSRPLPEDEFLRLLRDRVGVRAIRPVA